MDQYVWKNASPRYHWDEEEGKVNWMLVHSIDDELVDVSHSVQFYEYLVKMKKGGMVDKNFGLRGGHDGMLKTNEFFNVVAAWVRRKLSF